MRGTYPTGLGMGVEGEIELLLKVRSVAVPLISRARELLSVGLGSAWRRGATSSTR